MQISLAKKFTQPFGPVSGSVSLAKMRVICVAIAVAVLVFMGGCGLADTAQRPLAYVGTIAGSGGDIGEPFGIAERGGILYFSDGQSGKILRVTGDGVTGIFAEGLDTPSAIAFGPDGELIVADTGSHSIKSIDSDGKVSVIAGSQGRSGNSDGSAAAATFNAPVGVAVHADGRIFVAATYNDRIRVIEKGSVRTIAGGDTGFADGVGLESRFDTPTSIALWGERLIVADSGNRRIRVVETDGRTWTLAGNGQGDLSDGLLSQASFVQPTAVAVDSGGIIYIVDGNAIRRIGGSVMPLVTTISADGRGLKDGNAVKARFNRPSGLGFASNGDLVVADSENRVVRRFSTEKSSHVISKAEIDGLRDKPEVFREEQPARWPYDPPSAKRDIAGTLGEIRGLMTPEAKDVWYHNGLDIAGNYGETARFVRDEKVLRTTAAENFGTLRELIRMPTLGYIHIRLGRNASGEPFGDERFQFRRDSTGKTVGVRVPRGSKFKAGEPIGTLNPMNHVHLIAGRSGSEMNALDALKLPGITDSRPPVIEKVTIYDQDWNLVETVTERSRITVTGKMRIVIRAYDQVDGNADRRRLGVYRAGYEIWAGDSTVSTAPLGEIKFDRLPTSESLRYVYADGSHSGATGETIFSYIATNIVDGESYRESFLDAAAFENGTYLLRVFASDYFGNTSRRDISIEVKK